MKKMVFLGCLAFGLAASNVCFAESVEGVVKVVGSSISRSVMIYSVDNQKYKVCSDDLSKRISRLTGMTVKVSGDWKMKKEVKSCLTASAFEVLKTSSGRDAVVGVITETNQGFEVKSDGGKVHLFPQVPSGLKKLAGSKVIIDVKQMSSPTAAAASYKVVTYARFP